MIEVYTSYATTGMYFINFLNRKQKEYFYKDSESIEIRNFNQFYSNKSGNKDKIGVYELFWWNE